MMPAHAQVNDPAPHADQTEPAALPDMEAIEAAYLAGDFVTARAGLEILAQETETPLAQYRYGRILLEGRGGPRDIDGAELWLGKASAQNHLEATTLLARIYLSPETERKDPVRAAELLNQSAARGDAQAQYYLGLLFQTGEGVAADPAVAFTWFLAAAEQQNAKAALELGLAYAQGQGTEQDPEAALTWLSEAASHGLRDAHFHLALAYEAGLGTSPDATKAATWMLRAAEADNVVAQRMIGTRYLAGSGVAQNATEALRWFTLAAQAGDPGAMTNLGFAYAKGQGVPQNDAKAAFWYTQAVNQGIPRAALVLGLFYEQGRGVELDLSKAVELYIAAQEAGEAQAALRLGALAGAPELTSRVAPDRIAIWARAAAREGSAQAREWLSRQADEGLSAAQTGLAVLLLEEGSAPDQAAELLEAAARAGDTVAQFEFGKLLTTGTGVALDYVAAYTWLNIAAANAHAEAVDTRDTIIVLMTPEEIAAGQTKTRAYLAEDHDQ